MDLFSILMSPAVPIVLLFGAFVVGLVVLFRAALPKPIPGIPYNHASAKSVLGDIPSMVKWKSETKELFSWLRSQLYEHNVPMVQVFVKPGCLPWVIVGDYRECMDVLSRRSHEWDRSHFTSDVVTPVLREHHFPFPSGPKQKAHRALLSDLMTPAFLNEIASPRLYDTTLELLQLWRRKAELASGHAFAAAEDIANVALDTIWGASIGDETAMTRAGIELLAQTSAVTLPSQSDFPAQLPETPIPYDVECIRKVIGSMEFGQGSPLPALSYFVYLKLPHVRRAFRRKDEVLENAFQKSRARLVKGGKIDPEAPVTSAMDYVLRREFLQAARDNRPPRIDSKLAVVLKDELFGFLLAGHETTSTTIQWGLKLLTSHQEVQAKLRKALREAIPDAVAEGRQPTYSELTSTKIPYLDAVIEEMLRCGATASAHGREALVDTEILGVPVPKGTNVLFMMNGPSVLEPPMPVDEKLRSQSSQENKSKYPEWDPNDISLFKPERWLKTDSEGQEAIDWQAGPSTQFGGGARGCFGKKFAYLEMKTVVTIVFWNFKLLPIPVELSGNDAFDGVAHAPQKCYVRLAPLVDGLGLSHCGLSQ